MVLDGNLEIMEADVLEHVSFLQCGGHQCFRSGAAVFGVEFLVQRTGVHTDTQRDAGISGCFADRGADFIEFTDVAGVHAYGCAAGIDGLEHVLGLEVNIRDDRHRRLPADLRQCVGIVLTRHSHAHDIATSCGQLGNLLQCGRNIGRKRVGHRLHGDGGSPTDRHRADHDAVRLATRVQRRFAGQFDRITGFAERFFGGFFRIQGIHHCLFIKSSAR